MKPPGPPSLGAPAVGAWGSSARNPKKPSSKAPSKSAQNSRSPWMALAYFQRTVAGFWWSRAAISRWV